MRALPPLGTTGETRFVVEAMHAIDFAGAGMPAVLSSPALVGWLERAARESLGPFLEPGESSVGTEIELRHLAPTPLGVLVVCTARVIQVAGSTISFQVEARDTHEVIARGFHRRQVINVERFAQRVRPKTSRSPD
jgi:fluoroacetyl-CoA thioesterase